MERGMSSGDPAPTRVWDLPTRLFHWALVVLIAVQYTSGEFGWPSMAWHYRCGYATLALILFRIAWGFAGSQTSRFAEFLRGPRAMLRYLGDLAAGRSARMHGHNPLGGWSVVSMLASISLQAISGLFTSDDISEDGPLVARVSNATVSVMTRIHHLNRYVLLVLLVLHIGAVVLHWVLRNDNLVAAMLHGRRHVDANMPPPRFAPVARALALFALAALIVAILVEYGGVN
jgi:cytochrome b